MTKVLRKTNAKGGPWYEFQGEPCPICHKSDWCMIHHDQDKVVCQRTESKKPWGNAGGHLHSLKESSSYDLKNDVDFSEDIRTHEKKVDAHLHRIYIKMIEASDLTDEHYNHLTGDDRQLDERQIERRGYFSFPEKPWNLINDISHSLGLSDNDILLGTPGVYKFENRYQSFLSLNGFSSIMIPFRNEKQQVVGFQQRVDHVLYKPDLEIYRKGLTVKVIEQPNTVELSFNGKPFWIGEFPLEERKEIKVKKQALGTLKLKKGQRYLWLSSANKREGTSPGQPLPVHVSIPTKRLAEHSEGSTIKANTVWITEGPLKGDICADMIEKLYDAEEIDDIGDTFLCIPGVQSWRLLLPLLEKMEVKKVNLALDADAASNNNVKKPLFELAKELKARGLEGNMILWNEDHGKGLDDLFLNFQLPHIRKLF